MYHVSYKYHFGTQRSKMLEVCKQMLFYPVFPVIKLRARHAALGGNSNAFLPVQMAATDLPE